MANVKEISIKVDQNLFKRLMRDNQVAYTRKVANEEFAKWIKANDADIRKRLVAHLNKEIPALVEKEFPKMARKFYCGIDY